MRGWMVAAVVGCTFAVGAAAQSSDLFVTKSAPATANVGSNVIYSVTIGNVGPDDAPGATLTDTLPANATFVSQTQNNGATFNCTDPNVGDQAGTVSCTIASLVAGTSATFAITVNVQPAAAGTTLINTASVTSDNPDPNSENNNYVAGTDIPGGNLADVGVTKSGPSAAAPDTDVQYTITVTNFGPNDATNVLFSDTLPSGTPSSPMTFVSFNQTSGPAFNCPNPGATVNCSIATFTNGSTATFQFTGHIPPATVAGTTYTNKVTVNSDNDQTSENNTASATTTVSSADVSITKSAPPTATAGGANFTYIVTVTNGGPDATDVSWVDTLPNGINFVSLQQNTGPSFSCSTPPQTVNTISCSAPALANAASAQFTITVNASSSVANGTVITNTATVTTSSADPNANNNTSSASTTVSSNADISIVKSGPATQTAGSNINYTIVVTNNGPSTAASVSWTDTLPAGETFSSLTQNSGPAFNCTTGATISCSIASLASGATASFSLTVQTSPSASAGTLTNTAVVTSSTPDSTPGNNTSSFPTTLQQSADVAVTKSGPAAATAGSNVTYTITVANNGPSDAASVTLADTLPAGTTFVSENQTSGPAFNCTTGATVTCSIASLPSGASAVFSVTVAFSGGLANGSTVTNTANVTSTTADPNPVNNTSSSVATVGANADLAVTKSGPTTAPSSANANYTVTVTNNGPSTAANVTLTETVPANMSFVSANQTSGPAFNCSGTGPITCTIATLNSGASASFQFTFFVANGVPFGTATSNTATVSSTTLDANPANNTSTVNTTIGLSVPAMSDWMLGLLALALVGIAVMTLRR